MYRKANLCLTTIVKHGYNYKNSKVFRCTQNSLQTTILAKTLLAIPSNKDQAQFLAAILSGMQTFFHLFQMLLQVLMWTKSKGQFSKGYKNFHYKLIQDGEELKAVFSSGLLLCRMVCVLLLSHQNCLPRYLNLSLRYLQAF